MSINCDFKFGCEIQILCKFHVHTYRWSRVTDRRPTPVLRNYRFSGEALINIKCKNNRQKNDITIKIGENSHLVKTKQMIYNFIENHVIFPT